MGRRKFEFFNHMDEMLGDRPIRKPESLLESGVRAADTKEKFGIFVMNVKRLMLENQTKRIMQLRVLCGLPLKTYTLFYKNKVYKNIKAQKH